MMFADRNVKVVNRSHVITGSALLDYLQILIHSISFTEHVKQGFSPNRRISSS